MNDDNILFPVVVGIILGLGLICGTLIGWNVTKTDYQSQAIEHNYAGYDSLTGKWGWK